MMASRVIANASRRVPRWRLGRRQGWMHERKGREGRARSTPCGTGRKRCGRRTSLRASRNHGVRNDQGKLIADANHGFGHAFPLECLVESLPERRALRSWIVSAGRSSTTPSPRNRFGEKGRRRGFSRRGSSLLLDDHGRSSRRRSFKASCDGLCAPHPWATWERYRRLSIAPREKFEVAGRWTRFGGNAARSRQHIFFQPRSPRVVDSWWTTSGIGTAR